MNRLRATLKPSATWMILFVIVFWSSLLASESTAAPGKPNIVVFLTDDHGQLDSTPYGATDVRTPNLQRLAAAGLTFNRAFVATPACTPSRSAMLTGLMPARNGAEVNHSFKRDNVRSLPETLRALGYETAAFGKVAHNKADAARHGFDVINERYDAATVEKFLKERNASKPLCLFVGTHDPHVPWPQNQGYDPQQVKLPATLVDTPETRNFRARYYSAITQADTLLGKVSTLAKEHIPGTNTLFIYTSDHGAQWPFGKWNLYDAGIATPFIAAWPGVLKPGTRSDAMLQWIDLLPTFIEAAGGKVPEDIDGQSFLSVLQGKKTTHREVIFTTHSGDGRMNVYPIRAIRTADWKLILNLHPEFAYTTHIDKALARDGGAYWLSWYEAAKTNATAARIVKKYHERPAVEFYDLRTDPWEQTNLATDPAHAPRIKEMRTQLESWMRVQGDRETVFHQPRLLSEPGSTRPGRNSGTDNPAPANN